MYPQPLVRALERHAVQESLIYMWSVMMFWILASMIVSFGVTMAWQDKALARNVRALEACSNYTQTRESACHAASAGNETLHVETMSAIFDTCFEMLRGSL